MLDVRTQQSRAYNRHLIKTFVAVNGTAGTGLAEAVKTGFAATAAMTNLRNGGTAGYIRPQYLRIVNTVAPASGTAMHCRMAIDSGVTRRSSGGTALAPKNIDMSSAVAAAGAGFFGALVTAAATANVRYVHQSSPMTVIPVVGDNVIFLFNPKTGDLGGHGTLAGTTGRQMIIPCAPVVLGPSNELLIHTWYPSNATTPASWEIEWCWTESRR